MNEMLVECWSNHQQPIVHPYLKSLGDIIEYVKQREHVFKLEGVFKSSTVRKCHKVVTLDNGVTVTFSLAIIRQP